MTWVWERRFRCLLVRPPASSLFLFRRRDRGAALTIIAVFTVMAARQSKDPKRKTNLVVAPLALLDQWALEIETKSSYNLKVVSS
jgi:hypothetical protein